MIGATHSFGLTVTPRVGEPYTSWFAVEHDRDAAMRMELARGNEVETFWQDAPANDERMTR